MSSAQILLNTHVSRVLNTHLFRGRRLAASPVTARPLGCWETSIGKRAGKRPTGIWWKRGKLKKKEMCYVRWFVGEDHIKLSVVVAAASWYWYSKEGGLVKAKRMSAKSHTLLHHTPSSPSILINISFPCSPFVQSHRCLSSSSINSSIHPSLHPVTDWPFNIVWCSIHVFLHVKTTLG